MLAATPLLFAACGGGDSQAGEQVDEVIPAVIITTPAHNATVTGTVRFVLETRDVTIRPAGTDEPGTGHHHLFVDRDITPTGQPIPTETGIVHLGMAQSEYSFDSLSPGEHTIIAVIGDYQHVRLSGVATDTVRITVSGT